MTAPCADSLDGYPNVSSLSTSIEAPDLNDRDLQDLLVRHAPSAAMEAATRELAVRALAADLNIGVATNALQEAADRFRRERGLLTYDDTMRWLAQHWLSDRSWQDLLRSEARTQSLLEAEAVAARIDAEFEGHRDDYARALVAPLVVEDEGLAHELFLLGTEDGYDFDVIIRRYSIESARGTLGPRLTRRWCFRFALPLPVADAAFKAALDEPVVLRPLPHDDLWHVYKIYNACDAQLDQATRAAVSLRVLDAMLQPYIAAARSELRSRLGLPPTDHG